MSRRLVLGLLCIAALGTSRGAAADPPTAPPATRPSSAVAPIVIHDETPAPGVESFQLANGLRVILEEDHRSPRVAVRVSYGVGDRDQPTGYQGLAHLFEHLMFRGSRHVGATDFQTILDRVGATGVNATTSRDLTSYYETVPAEHVDLALWLESDRMAFLLDRLDQTALDTQRRVVLNELHDRYDGRVMGRAFQLLSEELYPAGHPYRFVTDNPRDLAAITLDHARWFFQTWYGPDNATLTLVGDFDPAGIRTSIDRYFSTIQRSPGTPIRDVAAPAPAAAVRTARENRVDALAPGNVERLFIAYRTPSWPSPDSHALEAAASLLGARESLFRRRIVETEGAATSLAARVFDGELDAMFVVEITAAEQRTAVQMLRAFDAAREELLDMDASDGRVRRFARQEELHAWESRADYAARAGHLDFYSRRGHATDLFARELEAYRRVSIADLRRVVRQHLAPQRRTVLLVQHSPDAPMGGCRATPFGCSMGRRLE